MLPYLSGIFTAILPCLAYDTEARRSILVFLSHLLLTFSNLWLKRNLKKWQHMLFIIIINNNYNEI